MRFNNQLFPLITVLLFCSGIAYAQDSKTTVEELLKLDNAQALQKAREEAAKNSGLGVKETKPNVKDGASKPIENYVQQWSIRSIYGSGSNLHADVVASGTVTTVNSQSSVVNGCLVTKIENKCIATTNSKPLGKNQFNSCPVRVCWTGDELAAELQPVQTKVSDKNPDKSLTPIPQPLPSPLPASGLLK